MLRVAGSPLTPGNTEMNPRFTFSIALVALGCTALLVAQEDESQEPARAQLVGVWNGYAVEGKGDNLNQGPVKLELKISPELIQAKQFKGEEVLDLGEGTFEIVHDKSPHHLDGNKKLANPKRKEVWLGIYRLEGDTLYWCVGRRTRPAEFETKEGAFLLILKRNSP
jgi:uncharacterized protein (TIGR03067 family)